jgi:hypothetical protein
VQRQEAADEKASHGVRVARHARGRQGRSASDFGAFGSGPLRARLGRFPR